MLQTMRSGGAQHPEEIMNFSQANGVLTGGILNKVSGDLAIAQQTVPNMTVQAAIGHAMLKKAGAEMTYPVRNTAASNVTIGANSSGNPRIDAIVLYIDLAASPNADISNVAKLVAVAGTPAGSPSAPTDANIVTALGASTPFLRLANVAVANGAVSIVTANITDTRVDVILNDFSNKDGWIPYADVIPTRASLDAPTAVLTIAGVNLTGLIGVGDRIKFTQNGALVYAIVTAIAFSTNTTLTIYCGTDYTVGDTATYPITNFFFSHAKSPIGFPMDPDKWTVTTTYSSSTTQSNPGDSTYYNVGSINIVAPIGKWNGYYSGSLYYTRNTAGNCVFISTLSTANNSESNVQHSTRHRVDQSINGETFVHKFIPTLLLAVKTTLYLNLRMAYPNAAGAIGWYGAEIPTIIKLVCAYL